MESRSPDSGLGGVIPHEVLSAASHELRGPLGVTRGYLRLLAQSPALEPRAARMVADAGRAAERMATLIEELSQYARWLKGEQKLATGPASLREIIDDAVDAAQLSFSPMVVAAPGAPGDASITADRQRLTTALSALIGAAARARVDDGNVSIEMLDTDSSHPHVRIGPPELWAGDTVERPATIERGGAGLSIALATLVVERHGGQLLEVSAGEAWGYECRL